MSTQRVARLNQIGKGVHPIFLLITIGFEAVTQTFIDSIGYLLFLTNVITLSTNTLTDRKKKYPPYRIIKAPSFLYMATKWKFDAPFVSILLIMCQLPNDNKIHQEIHKL